MTIINSYNDLLVLHPLKQSQQNAWDPPLKKNYPVIEWNNWIAMQTIIKSDDGEKCCPLYKFSMQQNSWPL